MGETDNRPGLTILLLQGWTPPEQTLALNSTKNNLYAPTSKWLPVGYLVGSASK